MLGGIIRTAAILDQILLKKRSRSFPINAL
jgi:hypothetical protein